MFLIIVIGTKYVSLGSVMCMLIYPFVLSNFKGPGFHVLSAFIVAALVIFMHRSNIKRLREGKESKISFKSHKKTSADGSSENKDGENKKLR